MPRIRCQPAFGHLPTVMLSAMPEPRYGSCWSAFFRKPADLDTLLRNVDVFTAERLGAVYARTAPSRLRPAAGGRSTRGAGSSAFRSVYPELRARGRQAMVGLASELPPIAPLP
jgi:hypothetical protein